MLLTIGMIVKNEEKYLDQCLKCIIPILDNVDSELIITDTGSTDNTIEIARKYTDKVFYFDWIDDFAAARNYGLKKAHGEWFMFLDADEFFENCDDIISFFSTGKYKKYSAATYIVRNIFEGENNYSDFMASRMSRIYPDTAFVGKIHEYLTHFTNPVYNISSIAIHYGYLFFDKQQAKKKAERNLKLLEESYNEHSFTNPLIFKQIYDSYCLIGESEKGQKYIDEGIRYCKKKQSLYTATYYCCKIFDAFQEDDIKSVEKTFEEYSEWKTSLHIKNLTTDVEMYAVYGELLYTHLNFEKAMNIFSQFFILYEDVKSGVLNTDDASALNFRLAIDRNYIGFVYDFVDACLICGNYDETLQFLVDHPLRDYKAKDEELALSFVNKIIEVLRLNSYKDGYRIYCNLDNYCRAVLIDALIFILNGNNQLYILDLMAKIGNDVDWLDDKVLIYDDLYKNGSLREEQLRDYVFKYGIMDNIDLIGHAMEKQIDISFMLQAKDIDMKKCAYLCCKNITGFYDIAENYNAPLALNKDSLQYVIKFYDYCISMKLIDYENSGVNKEDVISKLFSVKSKIKKQLEKIEFEELAYVVKQNIRDKIASGDIKGALQLVEEYKKIAPNDEEINEIINGIQV